MKRYIIVLFLISFCLNTWAQVHKVIWGDERYMICYDKTLEIVCNPKDNLADGKWIFYYDSAMTNIAKISYYKGGKRNGLFYSYRIDGSLAQLNMRINGILNGEYRSYYDNGQLKTKSYYYNHIAIGEYIIYDSSGYIIQYDIRPVPEEVKYRKPFIPDTIVNQNFILNSSISFQNMISYIRKINLNLLEEKTNLLFCNINQKQYLVAHIDKEDANKIFSCFEIGYTKSLVSMQEYIKLDYSDFSTQSGIKLGMTRNELLDIKGTDYYIMTEEYVRYIVDHSGKVMTNKNNELKYVLECKFDNDRITKIRMGLSPKN